MASVGTKRKRNGTPRIAPTWRRLECTGSASPAARSGFGFARVIGHGLVVFGGISSSGYLDDVWLLQCACAYMYTRRWRVGLAARGG